MRGRHTEGCSDPRCEGECKPDQEKRNELTLDLTNMGEDDMYVVLHAERYGLDAEPGEPFTMAFRSFLKQFCDMGYWPVDFGEANDTHTTLWLKYEPSVATRQTKHFIDMGGDV